MSQKIVMAADLVGRPLEAGMYMLGAEHSGPLSSDVGKKHDAGKLRYSLLPQGTEEAILQVLEFGAKKYGANNWQLLADAETRYYDALRRHLAAYNAGEALDADSGLPHLAHVLCNAAFLLWFQQKKEAK